MKRSKVLAAVLVCVVLVLAIGAVVRHQNAATAPEDTSQTEPTQDTASLTTEEDTASGFTFTDDLGREVTIASCERVVSLYGSYAEAWSLAGGNLVGVTEDAIEERHMDLGEDVAEIGSIKTPSLEAILALDPDFVMLSADTASQVDLEAALTEANVPHAYFRQDTFEDYQNMMKLFTTMTGQEDRYEQYAGQLSEQIDQIRQLFADQEGPTVLLLRAFSTGAKAKGNDNLAGVILEDLGADNLVDRYPSLLEDISIEEIISADPDFIFVTTMGDEGEALAALENGLLKNPAWESLSAVQQDHYFVLPKDLFHYKPNARWAESYAYLAKLLNPDLTETIDEIM